MSRVAPCVCGATPKPRKDGRGAWIVECSCAPKSGWWDKRFAAVDDWNARMEAMKARPSTVDHHQTNVMAPVEIGPVTPVEGLTSGEGEYDPTTIGRIRAGEQMHFTESNGLWAAMLGGSVQYQAWQPDESKVRGFSEGYNLALRHARAALAASPATPAGSVREAAYRCKGCGWASNDPIGCDHPQNGCDMEIMAPVRRALHPVDSRAQGGEKA